MKMIVAHPPSLFSGVYTSNENEMTSCDWLAAFPVASSLPLLLFLTE